MIESSTAKYTGAKMELCPVCGEVFNNTRAGDKHRVIAYTYTLVYFNGKAIRVIPEQDEMPKGAKILSVKNESRRCLSTDEMRRIGMNQEKNGAWNAGGNWGGWNG